MLGTTGAAAQKPYQCIIWPQATPTEVGKHGGLRVNDRERL